MDSTHNSGRHTRRVELAIAGKLAPEDLTEEEITAFTSAVNAGIADQVSTTNYAKKRAAQGLSSVALDKDGNIVEHLPDGKIEIVERAAYKQLSNWAETDEAVEAFAAAVDTPDDDATFQKVQKAARRELKRIHLNNPADDE